PVILGLRLRRVEASQVVVDAVERHDGLAAGAVSAVGGDATDGCPHLMGRLVSHVLPMSPPLEVYETIVCLDAVDMASLHSWGTRPDKCLQHEAVHVLLAAEEYAQVAVLFGVGRQPSPFVGLAPQRPVFVPARFDVPVIGDPQAVGGLAETRWCGHK